MRSMMSSAVKPADTGSRHQRADQLVELSLTFGVVRLDRERGDERADALLGAEDASDLELPVGADDGVGVDGEVDGQLPDRRQLVAWREGPGGDAAEDLVDDLAVDGDSAGHVPMEGGG